MEGASAGPIGQGVAQVRMLGELRVVTPGERDLGSPPGRQAASLLAYLIYYSSPVSPPRHRREALQDILFPGYTPEASQSNFRVALHRLRHYLKEEPEAEPRGGSAATAALIDADRTHCWANPAAFVSDVWRFEQAVVRAGYGATIVAARSGAMDISAERREEALLEAVSLYHGPLLSPLSDEWILPERQRWEETYLWALGELSRLHRLRGVPERALDFARRATTLDPFCEEAHGELIRLYLDLGRPDAALRQYDTLRSLLRRGIGGTPSPETAALVRPLLLQRQEQQQRDQERKQQVLLESVSRTGDKDVSRRDNPSVVPTPAYRRPARLPHRPLTRLFGREIAMRQLQALILGDAEGGNTQDRNRLVTLTGPGGSGKTRLALELAHQLREERGSAEGRSCVRRCWWVDLSSIPHGAGLTHLAETLAAALGIQGPPGRTVADPVAELIESIEALCQESPFPLEAPEVMLLYLDNAEHLLTAVETVTETQSEAPALVTLVQELLSRISSLHIVVTSRERLRLPGEREFPVAPLRVPGGTTGGVITTKTEDGSLLYSSSLPSGIQGDPVTELLSVPSVALFMDRARLRQPAFEINHGNMAAVAALCARLDGLPLAIELAAARVPTLTPNQILSLLDQGPQGLSLLSNREHGAPTRHQTLLAAIEWSYRALPPELRRFFAALSVFRDGWSLEAAAYICLGRDEGQAESKESGKVLVPGPAEVSMALDYLNRLRECSLVEIVCLEAEEGETNVEEDTDEYEDPLEHLPSRAPRIPLPGLHCRFRLLETMRDFGAGRLSPGRAATLRRRHALFFGAPLVEGQTTQSECHQIIGRELDNIRCALEWQCHQQEGEDAVFVLRLAHVFGNYCFNVNLTREGRRQLVQAVAYAERSVAGTDDRAVMNSFLGCAYQAIWFAAILCDWDQVEMLYHKCARMLAEQRPEYREFWLRQLLITYAASLVMRGNFNEALLSSAQMLEISTDETRIGGYQSLCVPGIGDLYCDISQEKVSNQVFLLLNIGAIYCREGRYSEAEVVYRAAAQLAKIDPTALPALGGAFCMWGFAQIKQGFLKAARVHLDAGLGYLREAQYRSYFDRVARFPGEWCLAAGQWQEAAGIFLQCIPPLWVERDYMSILYCVEGLARAALPLAQPGRTLFLIGAVEAISQRVRLPLTRFEAEELERLREAAQAQATSAGIDAQEAWQSGFSSSLVSTIRQILRYDW